MLFPPSAQLHCINIFAPHYNLYLNLFNFKFNWIVRKATHGQGAIFLKVLHVMAKLAIQMNQEQDNVGFQVVEVPQSTWAPATQVLRINCSLF